MTQVERTFNFMKKPAVIAVYAVLVILVYIFLDKALATHFYQLNTRVNLHILQLFTGAGQVFIWLILFSLAGLFYRYGRANALYEQRSWLMLLCVLMPNLVCLITKIILGRARPELLFSINAFGFYWFKLNSSYWSFPSGHTTTVIGLASGLGVIFPRYFYIYLILALGVILTRVLLYYHYLSDVMATFYLAILVAGVTVQYIKRNQYLARAWKK